MWILRGNATESGDLGGSPKKSSLFFLTVCHPEIGLSGARVQWLEERCTFAAFGALPTSLENPLEEIVFTPGRTHNRSRSPRVGVRWALGRSFRRQKGTSRKVGTFQRWDAGTLGRPRPSGVRLTTNLELVRTRGI
ncbi:hypothetical protein EJ07DRAFT_170265 [Lizonia empirigonia]|nr:hypothetical protein EJ07DRAFT_170265 [Lizonia empirigonia]